MAEDTGKTLFFIKSPTANITAIESFLKKRDFNVVSESDLKLAVMEIMKISPEYIFIAWDHPSDRIVNLPKFILQSVMTTIIAYCSSNNRLQVRKLQGSGQPLKLFPPLSGPAIQRLISRLEKDKETSNNTTEQANKKNEAQKMAADSNMIQIKSGIKNEELDNFINDLPESSSELSQRPSEMFFDKGKRAADIRNYQQSKRSPSPQQNSQFGQGTHQNFQSGIDQQSINELLQLDPSEFGKSISTNKTPSPNDNTNTPKLSENAKSKLKLKFDEQIRIPIEEMLETLLESDQSTDYSQLKNENIEQTKVGFCVVVEHSNWSGYLISASEEGLDPVNLEMLLTNWISENLEEDTSVSSQLILNSFEIKLFDVAFEKFSTELADYTQTMTLNSKKTVLSFFSFAPEVLTLQLHELHDMFEIMTSEIPISVALPFDINLYLPENRKFLLYSKPNTVFAAVQLERMREKRVEKLYASIEFENALQKFRAEARIRFMVEKFKAQHRKQSS